MQHIHKSIDINAPAQRVFDFLLDPRNLPSVWPGLEEVSNVNLEQGALEYDWVYKMAGMHFRGHSSTQEIQPGKLLRWHAGGALDASFRWALEGRDGTTTFTVDVDYTLPGKVLGRIAEVLAAKTNERESETFLGNVKSRMETAAKAPEAAAAQPHA